MADERLRRLSNVTIPKSDIDSVSTQKEMGNRRAFNLVLEAQHHWDNMARFRKDRQRVKNYVYGKQWGDIIKDSDDGKWKTEEEYIREQGNEPLTNNLMRRLVRNVLGVYRSQQKEPTCTARDRDEQKFGETMSTILQCNMQLNRMNEVYPRTMEEFLISGFIVHRKWFGWRDGKLDCWTDYVQPDNFFIDSNMRDFRGWDVSFLGEIHDISFNTLAGRFAHNKEEYTRLANIYSTAHARSRQYVGEFYNEFGHYRPQNLDFLIPQDLSRCRVIEVWKKETKARYRCRDYQNGDVFKIDIEDYDTEVRLVNEQRRELGRRQGIPESEIPYITSEWFIDEYWYYYLLTPFGDILDEGETPYEHKSHPYVFKAYPFIDGEIHGFAGDFLDQQRYTNRLITMYDWIMRASAKGVLLFPEECLPQGMDIDDIADEWHRFNGVIAIKTKNLPNGVLPQQIANNSTNIGISELLNLQLKFFEDISGVNGALQGKPGYAGTSGSKYAQETQNATTSLLDLLATFSMFVIDGAYKDVKNMQQFYDTKRVFNIAGKAGAQIEYDPKKIRDVEFDLSIIESTATPAYRAMANEFLMTIWQSGQISLQQLLEHGDFPFSDDLLQSIKSQQEQIAKGQTPDGISPELQQQVQQGANMQNVNKAYQMLTGNAA